MSDLYLLFADDLAQAIAEGRKTVTRRPMTARNSDRVAFFSSFMPDGQLGGFADLDWDAHLITGDHQPPQRGATPCTGRCLGRDYCCCLIDGEPTHGGGYLHVPGKGGETRQRVFCRNSPGDMLVVRECFAVIGDRGLIYRGAKREATDGGRWTPSIHMKRSQARSIRKITSITPDLVGPEPLSKEEAAREGFASPAAFAAAWDRMYLAKHGPRVWSWRIEFEPRNA